MYIYLLATLYVSLEETIRYKYDEYFIIDSNLVGHNSDVIR